MIRYIHDQINGDLIRQAYEKFKKLNLWRGPSLDFHCMTISHLRQKQQAPNFSYLSLSEDQCFLILLYGTVATWGIHRMGAKRRMVNFTIFKKQVESISELLDNIKGITLSNSTLAEINNEEKRIRCLFKKPTITERKDLQRGNQVPFLVPNSKLLHHLHPDLFPPIDWRYIFRYFYYEDINAKQVYRQGTTDRQTEWFWEILTEYKRFYDSHQGIVDSFLGQDITGMETSITKIIDNIVVGYTAVMRSK